MWPSRFVRAMRDAAARTRLPAAGSVIAAGFSAVLQNLKEVCRSPASISAYLPLCVRPSVRPAHGSRKRRRTDDHDPEALEFPHAGQHHGWRQKPVRKRDHSAPGRRLRRRVDGPEPHLQPARRGRCRPALRCRGQQGGRRGHSSASSRAGTNSRPRSPPWRTATLPWRSSICSTTTTISTCAFSILR